MVRRKRHIIVDNQGGIVVAYVSANDVNDQSALRVVLPILKGTYATVIKIWADMV